MTCHIMSNGSLKHSYILEYIIEIEKGNIIVGEELKIQLEKLKRELTDPIYQNLKKIEIDINPLRDRWREKAIKTHIEILTFFSKVLKEW